MFRIEWNNVKTGEIGRGTNCMSYAVATANVDELNGVYNGSILHWIVEDG